MREATMRAKNDTLEKAMGELERALAEEAVGREADWAGRVDQVLAGIEAAVQQRAANLEPPDGKVVEVDRPRLPSPTVSRRAAGLRQELAGVLAEAQALRARVRGAVQAFGVPVQPAGLAGALPVAPEAGAIPDFGVFRQRVRELLTALAQYEEEEARLILESVTTDIGAPD
jgi:hypothetical protein